ncbi:MAG: cell division protein FtsA [Deltaproteobacteria bacterium RIFCSPLOWO2_02_FULL_50_16]|nr:MAG: cell division protein FtsA [Deltaproteobacteria bacterium GWA2_50_8]OGQ25976.1 MAG: cell division protein FtsA [Deltaproteobacteria bacterium RIFCSPHIGHO2_02_FULL_50_15]OGQ55480.1 MAG: cell division protein FtsA [Deltaproteobacteria bacterium RIFCSPLOWO2_02_FULL_50_16]OGQ66793.1 MAG: cell division protein FtsA [Deltaproteobacteria bacterium RIFCSPLOWO2_12_FULL_50_11]
MTKQEEIIVGLDIGTTKICAIVGQATDDGIDIIGIGSHPSRGLRKGVVVNIESTVESIKKAVEEAELMAGCEISSVYAGIAGGHIRGINSHGVVALKDKEVRQIDVDRVIHAAQAVAIPLDREVIHVIPQEFVLDDQDGIHDPVGMSGIRFEARIHIVTAAVTSAQNIIKSVNRAGLNVDDIVLEQLASSESSLTREEKDLGVAIIDIGGGTTDLAIFSQGSIVHTSVLSLGGNHLTNDIAVGLRTPAVEAEKIKRKYGCSIPTMVQKEETIEVPSVGGRGERLLSRQILAEIIEPRMEEIFSLVRQEITKSGYEDLIASGVVLTGGTANLQGISELAEQIFNLPVRVGTPHGVGGLVEVVQNPMYATGVGLALYGCHNQSEKKFRVRDTNIYFKVKERMREWLNDIF